MKYVFMSLGALFLCFILAGLPAFVIGKKKHLKKFTTVFLAVLFALILICGVSLTYLEIYYHPDASAFVTSQTVEMKKIEGGYFFDGPGDEKALIFYPGAKVATEAYTPLMTALAEHGVDCFLADLPFRIAFLGSKKADQFLDAYTYQTWTAAGHSMGGLVVSSYAADHSDQFDHLILLASYPGREIPDKLSLCSIYGTMDGCLSLEAYEKAKEYWPVNASEFIIEGGNHARFANYGKQAGDLDAAISWEEQQEETLSIILKELGLE